MKLLTYPYWARFRGVMYAGLNSKVIIRKPLLMTSRFIHFGYDIGIQKNCRIEGISLYEGIVYNPRIILNDGVSIQQNLHLTCAECIEIGQYTAIGANVTITDIDHPYDDIHLPIEFQQLRVLPVKIGEDCKIYNNAVILSGTQIGKHCVVGANSVVKGKFPDYCVIAGIPARIIKRYNPVLGIWEKM